MASLLTTSDLFVMLFDQKYKCLFLGDFFDKTFMLTYLSL